MVIKSTASTAPHATCTADVQATPEPCRAMFWQAPLATEDELSRVHDRGYVRRFLTGDVTDADMRAVGLPWSPSLATYCRCACPRTELTAGVTAIISAYCSACLPSAWFCRWRLDMRCVVRTAVGVGEVLSAAPVMCCLRHCPEVTVC